MALTSNFTTAEVVDTMLKSPDPKWSIDATHELVKRAKQGDLLAQQALDKHATNVEWRSSKKWLWIGGIVGGLLILKKLAK